MVFPELQRQKGKTNVVPRHNMFLLNIPHSRKEKKKEEKIICRCGLIQVSTKETTECNSIEKEKETALPEEALHRYSLNE